MSAMRIGMLGGGQLGRMMAMAAAKLGMTVHVYCPEPDSPAFDVAAAHTIATYDDTEALQRFAASVDVVTYEFENVPAATADLLAAHVPVRPGTAALAVAQDRLTEKRYLSSLGIPTAPFEPVDGPEDLAAAVARIGLPAILKTRRMGYDGKGQAKILTPEGMGPALAAMGGRPAILEGFVTFSREISVIVARGLDGSTAVYDVPENDHRDHILRRSTVPAAITATTATAAAGIGERLVSALGYVGVLAVELFVVDGPDGEQLIANEIAPRVHNSGHWTETACHVSQFEMHIRAVAGLPLGRPDRHADVVMENLIGDDVARLPALLADSSAHVHLYGKHEIRAGRKMGHVNWLTPANPPST